MPSNTTTFYLETATCFGRIGEPQALGATVQSLVARATLRPRFVHPVQYHAESDETMRRLGFSRQY